MVFTEFKGLLNTTHYLAFRFNGNSVIIYKLRPTETSHCSGTFVTKITIRWNRQKSNRCQSIDMFDRFEAISWLIVINAFQIDGFYQKNISYVGTMITIFYVSWLVRVKTSILTVYLVKEMNVTVKRSIQVYGRIICTIVLLVVHSTNIVLNTSLLTTNRSA